jgi:UDP-N-acetyl-2-amino-2-deoxyglucuronate dehydrogenase
MKKVKFAVIGCGHIGKRHAEMICKNEDAELVALIDVKNREDLNIEKFNVPFFNSLKDFFQSGVEVDVVNIATPNGFHSNQALECLHQKKHVVIEKPIALSKREAEKILFKALNVHCQVFAVMQNRFSPPSIWVKNVIESNILGQINLVQLNCFWNRDERYYTKESWHGKLDLDGGTLYTQFSHFIDIMFWLFGDISNISKKIINFNHQQLTDFEDTGLVHFDFINGGIGSLNFTTSVWDRNLESSMTIIGQNGSIKIGGQYMDKVEYCHIKNYQMPLLDPTNPGNDYGAYKGSAQNHNYVIDNVIDTLNNKSIISTNALEGMKVVEIIENIYSK